MQIHFSKDEDNMNNNICKFPLSGTANGLSVSCFVLETDLRTMQNATTLSYHRVILVLQGDGKFLFDGAPTPFSAGSLLFGFEGEKFVLCEGSNVRYLYLDFSGARTATFFQRFGIHPNSRKKDNQHALIPFCKDCLVSTQQENIDLVAESVLLYIFSRLSADLTPQNDTIQKIIAISEERFHDSELSLTGIAGEIGYHPKYLSHFFMEKMNVSYSDYLRSLRFKYAISLFKLGISSVKNVAFLSGFSDPLYFSSAFKKAIGISPREFIASVSNKKEKTN